MITWHTPDFLARRVRLKRLSQGYCALIANLIGIEEQLFKGCVSHESLGKGVCPHIANCMIADHQNFETCVCLKGFAEKLSA